MLRSELIDLIGVYLERRGNLPDYPVQGAGPARFDEVDGTRSHTSQRRHLADGQEALHPRFAERPRTARNTGRQTITHTAPPPLTSAAVIAVVALARATGRDGHRPASFLPVPTTTVNPSGATQSVSPRR